MNSFEIEAARLESLRKNVEDSIKDFAKSVFKAFFDEYRLEHYDHQTVRIFVDGEEEQLHCDYVNVDSRDPMDCYIKFIDVNEDGTILNIGAYAYYECEEIEDSYVNGFYGFDQLHFANVVARQLGGNIYKPKF